MGHSAISLLANQAAFRPQIIEGGYRTNPAAESIRAGWPWISDRWRIWQVEDGVLTWHHGEQVHECTAGMWVVHQADRVTSSMSASPGAKWAQLRFRLLPNEPNGDAVSEELFGVSLPAVWSAKETATLRPHFRDMLAWWWRDEWHRLRADMTLGQLLIDIVAAHRSVDSAAHGAYVRTDRFRPADMIWQSRPLASIAELAAACDMSERHFRRAFRLARGAAPAAYARMLMARQACDALRDQPTWTIDEVAHHLGYAHTSTFVRAFRSEMAVTPDRWRQRRKRR